MNSQQIVKLRARAEHLLDLFIGLRERHALLRPLAFDRSLAERVGSGPASRGHLILKTTLLWICVGDLYKVTLDRSARSPSVVNIMTTLDGPSVRDRLRKEFSVRILPQVDHEDPSVIAALAQMRAMEEGQRRESFDRSWKQLGDEWTALQAENALNRFKEWRDELIAHADLRQAEGKYRLLDLGSLDLRWSDLGGLLDRVQSIVVLITLLVRHASFDFADLGSSLRNASEAFWDLLRVSDVAG